MNAIAIETQLETFELRQVEMIIGVITGEKSLPVPLAIPRHTKTMYLWEVHGLYTDEVIETVARQTGWHIFHREEFQAVFSRPRFEVIK